MERYNHKKIEAGWQKIWLKEKIYEPDLKKAKKPFYNLMMFPYPSAEGLHVGNMYAFTGADIYGRLKRMQGYDVFEPIGLDGFGIHSENYALKIGKHPAEQAKISEKNFYRQLGIIGNGFAWNERLQTYDPDYYQWTQWIFVQMFKRGLAYRKKAMVNWCPSCKTVLADEQVLSGECERCGTMVIKKELEQWFFKITDYAGRLLDNLEKKDFDWSEKIKIAQKNWIGKSEGAEIEFRILNLEFKIKVFTTRPDTLFGATYIVLAPENPLIEDLKLKIKNWSEVEDYIRKAKNKSEAERIAEGREKTGVELKGVKAVNPANKEEIPVWVADYVLGNVGTGAIMAVPAHDQRDFEFAQKFNLPIKIVVCPHYPAATCPVLDKAYEGGGHLVDSGKFNGMASEEARDAIIKFVGGKKKIKYRLRDWLISRQRYWGPPIPLIFCENCKKLAENPKSKIQNPKFSKGELENPGWIAVPEKDLPVKLPYIKNFRPTGTEKSPLATVEKFYKVRCPKCKGWAKRETDVSDTFLDSAWYYIGYLMAAENWKLKIENRKLQEVMRKWLPADMYIGGAEHAVLHLLYVRFLAMAFYDWEITGFEEPFKKFRAHGLLIKDGAKMSKSRGNVVNPDEYINVYGADTLRMYLMFLGPFEQGGDFRDTGIRGIIRFLERIWKFVQGRIFQNPKSKILNPKQISNFKYQIQNDDLERLVQRTIKKVTEDIENLQYNTAISSLMILLNAFEENSGSVTNAHLKIFLKLLAPFAPHITEELWSRLGENFSIHKSDWPKYDPKFIEEKKLIIVVQVNGKVRDKLEVEKNISEADLKKLVLDRQKIGQIVGEPSKIKKFVYIKGRLVNIVI